MVNVVEMVKAEIKANWMAQVQDGLISAEGMAESLREQISGDLDLSADEYDPSMGDILGWDDLIPDAWLDIINQAAREYLGI